MISTKMKESLAGLANASTEEIMEIRDRLSRVVELRGQQAELLCQDGKNQNPGNSNDVEPPSDQQAPDELRPPREGSVRADVYQVMSSGQPMRVFEIITAVARKRGTQVEKHLAATVGGVLRDRNDHRIEKVDRGLYRMQNIS